MKKIILAGLAVMFALGAAQAQFPNSDNGQGYSTVYPTNGAPTAIRENCYIGSGTPNAVATGTSTLINASGTTTYIAYTQGVSGHVGDVYTDETTLTRYIKVAGNVSGTNAWVTIPTTTGTATAVASAGSIVTTSTSVKIYLSATNGILVNGTGVLTISGSNYAF